MKKHIVILTAVIIAAVMLSFSSCTKPEPVPEEPPVSTQKDKGDEPENSTAASSEPESKAPDYEYIVDRNYVLQEDCKVYDDASDSARLKKREELSEDAKSQAVSGNDAILKKDTVVTCLETKENWMRIPSGWICCWGKDKLYVSYCLILKDEDIKEKGSKSPGTMYDINGNLICDAYKMMPSDRALEGEYTFIKQGSEDHDVSGSFNADGTCVLKYSEEVPLYTDEDGYWTGCKYTVKDDIVYVYRGGTSSISAYDIGKGDTLEFLYSSSSNIEITFN